MKRRLLGLVPDVVTYSALNRGCANSNQPKEALEMYNVMQQQGLVHDVITYHALVGARGNSDQPERTMEIHVAI